MNKTLKIGQIWNKSRPDIYKLDTEKIVSN